MPFEAILRKYDPVGPWEIEGGLSGWNNTTRFVRSNGLRRVLRIYETHRDAAKVAFEHRLLDALGQADLSFRVPSPIPCNDGSTIVRLEDGSGRLACLFDYIEGERPPESNAQAAEALGRATGELIGALGSLRPEGLPAYHPYYELATSYPLCTEANVSAFCRNPPGPLSGLRGELQAIEARIGGIRNGLNRFRSLPHQLIHGDINVSNALAADGRIVAMLDFEFCTRDLRAMEIAVALSGYLNEEEPLASADAFLSGAGEKVRLTPEEAEAIPELMLLRALDVFLHFLNRYFDEVDGPDVIRTQTESASNSLRTWDGLRESVRDAARRRLSD